MISKGIMCISLDTELLWGMHDTIDLEDAYINRIRSVNSKVIPALLELFDRYDVHVSWAVVGGIMLDNGQEYIKNAPQEDMYPSYLNDRRSSYRFRDEWGKEKKTDELFFQPEIIETISKYPNQYIGSHTYSHYYCREAGQTKEQFAADTDSAVAVAEKRGMLLRSIVFPKNEVNDDYLEVCYKAGFKVYRGIEENWIYMLKNRTLQRILRFADSYFPLSGSNVALPQYVHSMMNIRGSRILRPYNRKLFFLEELKVRRIKGQMLHAAKHGGVFHLWWHPHNFGADLEKNIEMLESILRYYEELKQKYGLASMSMEEIFESYEK